MQITATHRDRRIRFVPAVAFAAALLGLCATASVGVAQEHDHAHDHASQVESTEAGPGNPELEAAIYEEVAAPVVEAYRSEFETLSKPESLRTPLRALVGKIYDTVAERLPDDVPNRVTVTRRIHDRFLTEIEKLASTPARREALHALFEEAKEADLTARREYLWSAIMCWCPKEKWTRTLAGCPDGCADEQKSMVSAWLSEGRTSDEVVELMVAHPKGGEKVRGYLKPTGVNRLGYVLPFLFFAVAAVVLGLVLRRVIRKNDEPHPSASGASGATSDAGSDSSSDDDKHWGDLVEKELKEMDN